MASRYWVGGSATWDATAGTKWAATSGGAGGASVPTAADDVFFDAASGAVTVTIAASFTASIGSFNATGFTGTLQYSSGSVLSVAGTVFTLSSGMSYNPVGGSGTLAFTGTTTTLVTTAGKAIGHASIQLSKTGAGIVRLADALTGSAALALTLNSGTFDTNGQSVTAGSFVSSNTNTRTLTLGSSSITLTGSNGSVSLTATNLTTTANTATITFTGATSGISTGGVAWNANGLSIVHTGGSTGGFGLLGAGGLTIANLTITGTAIKTNLYTFGANVTITGTLTVNGNSATNRVLVQSNVVGTPRTITAAAVAGSNFDLMDITGAGAASWNLSAIAGGSGDAGGNTGITFTSSSTQTHTATAGGNWSDVTKWTSRVPLPQDDVIVDATTTGTLTLDVPRAGRSLNFTGFAGTLSIGVAFSLFGSLTFSAGMTYTNGTGFVVTVAGRGSYTITSAGKTFPNAITIGAPGGTYTLTDALVSTGASGVILGNGTLDTNGQNVTAPRFQTSGTATKALTLGTSTVTITTTVTGNAFVLSATGMTASVASSTIVFAAATVTRTFDGGGLTYGTLSYTVADSPGALLIVGSNTIGTLNVGPGRTLQITAGTTQTVTTWNVNGVQRDYVYLPGIAGAYVSTPDAPANSITADLTIDVRVALNDWTPAALGVLVAKFAATGSRSYQLQVNPAGTVSLFTSTDGTALVSATSTVAVGAADGSTLWIRACRNATTGNFRFYTSPDHVVWTQLGATVAGAAGAIFDSTSPVEIGSNLVGTGNQATGKLYNAAVYAADLGNAAGAPVQSFDASRKDPTADTYTAPTGEVWTLNGQARQGDGRVTLESSVAASSATVSTPTSTHSKYLTLQDITGAGAGIKNARRSRIVSNVTGWNVALSAKLYRSGGTFRVKPHRAKVAGTMTEKRDLVRTAGTFGP